MIARLLYWLARNRPCRLIKLDDQPYLERYYLGKLRGKYFYLHRFVRNDHERHLHDHPWRKAWSLVLAGWYVEQRGLAAKDGILMRRVRVTRFNRLERNRRFTDLHRIEQIRPETWTLFWHTEWEYPWGFYSVERRRCDTDTQGATTIHVGWKYEPYPVSKESHTWWLDAPRAKHIGREPFGR